MKATVQLSKTELEELIVAHFAKIGIKVTSPVGFMLREEGNRAGDTYKVFSHAAIAVEMPTELFPQPR